LADAGAASFVSTQQEKDMKKTEQPNRQQAAGDQIRPLSAEEIHAVSGGANGKKPGIPGPQGGRVNSTSVTKASFYR